MNYNIYFGQNKIWHYYQKENTIFNSFLFICFFLFFSVSVTGKEKLKYVNPFIGTAPTSQPSNWDGHGRTFPGAVAPFGILQLTPETRISSGKGYDFRDSVIYFFSCLGHLSGYPNGSAGNIKFMPIENSDSFELNIHNRPFSHQNEIAEPGYYKVMFDDNGTTVETSASTRSGMFRFIYGKNTTPKIFVGDLGTIELEAGTTVKGTNRTIAEKQRTCKCNYNG